GAHRTAGLVWRSEHEVIHEQLGAAVEEIGQGLHAVHGHEPVVLLDRDPRQLAPLPGQLVAAAGELLLLLQQLVALRLPFLLRADPVLSHKVPPPVWVRRTSLYRKHRRATRAAPRHGRPRPVRRTRWEQVYQPS